MKSKGCMTWCVNVPHVVPCKGLVCVQGSCLVLLVFGGWWARIQDNSDEAQERWHWHRWGKLRWGGGSHTTRPPAPANGVQPRRTATYDLLARWGQRQTGAYRDTSHLDIINGNLQGKCQTFLIQSRTCKSDEKSSVLASVNVVISIVTATAAQILNDADSPADSWQRNRRWGWKHSCAWAHVLTCGLWRLSWRSSA